MSYRVKRIDPFWINNLALAAVAAVAAVAALALINRDMVPAAIASAVVFGVAVVLMTKPVISAILGTVGLAGGLMTFVFVPSAQNASLAFPMRLLSTLLFTLFYMALMDLVVLVVSVLYNIYTGVFGLGGVSLDLEDAGAGEA